MTAVIRQKPLGQYRGTGTRAAYNSGTAVVLRKRGRPEQTTLTTLKIHEKAHTGKRKLKCSQCNQKSKMEYR